MTTIQCLESAIRNIVTREDELGVVRLARRAGMCPLCALDGVLEPKVWGTWRRESQPGWLHGEESKEPLPCWRCPRHGTTLCSSDELIENFYKRPLESYPDYSWAL